MMEVAPTTLRKLSVIKLLIIIQTFTNNKNGKNNNI